MPKRLSRAAERTIAMAPELSDADIALLIRSTPGWYAAVAPPKVEAKEYPKRAADFMEQTLGYTMWPKLQEICESVESTPATVVESGFGCGKSISAASIACWFVTTFQPAVVITLAPTWSQVQSIVWQYIRQVGRKAGLPGTILETPRWTISESQFAYGLSPRKTTDTDMASLQGRHAVNQLVIMDEAAGLPRKIWETVMGLVVSENNRVLAIGNPIGKSGPFYDATQSANWSHIRISCFDHPNVVQGKEVIPGAVSRRWIEDRATEWASPCDPHTPGSVHLWWMGEDEGWYYPQGIFTAKVLGIAPDEADDQLIQTSWVVDAENRELPDGDSVVLSCDPAPRGGDDTAMAARTGNKVAWVKRRKTHDTAEIVRWIKQELGDSNATRVYVDETGSGVAVVDECKRQELPVVAVNSSRAAIQRKRFTNVRSEMWWHLREALRLGQVSLPRDSILESDLTAVMIDRNELYGRIQLEDKEETKKRIQRSPDSGDAVALLYTLPNAGTDIDYEQMQKVLTKGSGGRSISRWVVNPSRNGSRWRK